MLIDIHVHTCRARHPLITRPNGSHYPTPETLLDMMDAADIDKALCMCTVNPEYRYTLVDMEETVAIATEHPDRLIPTCSLDPRWLTNSSTADFRRLLTAFKDMGCRAVGEYIPNLPFDDPLNLNLFAQVEEAGLPLTFHVAPQIGGCYGCFDDVGLPRLETVLKTFPDLVLLGHSQPFWAEIGTNLLDADGNRTGYPEGKVDPGRLVELFRAYPNLYGDLSARSGYNAISRDPEFGCAFMEEFQDRLCFGTDIANVPQELPIVSYFRQLRDESLIPREVHEKIAWRNATRILHLDA